MCLVKVGFGMCVYLYFIPNKICVGFISSEHAQTSFFPIEKPGVVQGMRQWEPKPRNYGRGCGAGAEQGGVCHSCAPTDALSSSPSFPLADSPKEDSLIQRSALQCLITERTIGERGRTLMRGAVNLWGRQKELPLSCRERDLLGKGLGCERNEGQGFDEEGQLETGAGLIGKGRWEHLGGKEGTRRQKAGRSRDQVLGCSEALQMVAPRALLGGDRGGELRRRESRVRTNSNCRGKTGSSSKSGLPASLFEWLCRRLAVDQPLRWSAGPQGYGDLPSTIPSSTLTFLLQTKTPLIPSA